MSFTNVIIGLSSFTAFLCMTRVYCIYFVWGRSKRNKLLNGKTVIITGANSGIGYETAKELVSRGARVIIACRGEESAAMAMEMINNTVKHNGQLIYKHIDLSSFACVKQFANEVIQLEPSIDILINNAGVYSCPFNITKDGYETQMQINHLSNALLTMLLLPKLETAKDPRIIMVNSSLYTRGIINENDFKKGSANIRDYDKYKSYCNSKLSNVLFTREFVQRLQKINSHVGIYTVSPGIVWTQLHRYTRISWWKMILLSPFAMLMLRTPNQGCQTVVHCATADSLVSGKFYRNCRENKWSIITEDQSLNKKVYDMTFDVIENQVKNRI